MPISFYLMIAIGVLMLGNGLLRKGCLWEAPTWVGFIFVSFMIPQAIHIEISGLGARIDSWLAWYYITSCLIAFWWAFGAAKRRSPRSVFQPPRRVYDNQLALRALVILFFGAVSLLQIRKMTEGAGIHGEATGIITLFYLIFQCIFMSLAIAVMRWFSSGRMIWVVFGAIAITLALIAISANAKRSLTAEIVFIIGTGLFFFRGWVPPRSVMLTLMIVGTVLVHQVGSIRDYVRAGNGNAFDAVIAGVPFENFAYFNSGKAPELTQGVVDIYRANQTTRLDGPAFLWNKMVHQYVPAFLVGANVKESLKVDLPGYFDDDLHVFDWHGATRTGFSDSYNGYNFFGFFIFALLGWFMGKLYARAQAGVPWALFLYPLLINDSMFAITESTARFFSGGFFVVFVTIFLFWRSSAAQGAWPSTHSFPSRERALCAERARGARLAYSRGATSPPACLTQAVPSCSNPP